MAEVPLHCLDIVSRADSGNGVTVPQIVEAGFDLKAIPVVMLGGGAAVVKRNVAPQDGLCRVFALLDDRETLKDSSGFWGVCQAVWARDEQAPFYVPPKPPE